MLLDQIKDFNYVKLPTAIYMYFHIYLNFIIKDKPRE